MNNNLLNFRDNVPAARKFAYFDTAEMGLVPDFIYHAVSAYQLDRFQLNEFAWDIGKDEPAGFLEMMNWTKAQLADMIGADSHNIFFAANASHAFSVLSSNIDLDPGDNIVLPEKGWMANRFAWQARCDEGIELRYVKQSCGRIDADDIIKACDEHTKVVSFPYVESKTGFRYDIKALGKYCREHDIILAADGVQGIGVLNINVIDENIDFIVGNDYKWMMGFCGTGFGYISDRLMEIIKPKAVGWMSDDERFNTDKQILRLRDDAGRFETGYPDVSGIYALGLSANNYNRIGSSDIEEYIFGLADHLVEGIHEIPDISVLDIFPKQNRSAILNIVLPSGDFVPDSDYFKERGVFTDVTYLGGDAVCRISIHYYNNNEDVDTLINVLQNMKKVL